MDSICGVNGDNPELVIYKKRQIIRYIDVRNMSNIVNLLDKYKQ